MEQVVFVAAGGGTITWTPDHDVVLVGGYVESNGANVSVSTDPAVTASPPAGAQLNLILTNYGSFGSHVNGLPRVLSYPVGKGQTVFCVTDSAAHVTLSYNNTANSLT